MNFAFIFSFLLVYFFIQYLTFFCRLFYFFESICELITSWLNEDIKSLNDSCSDDSENDDNTISEEGHIEKNYESDETTENTDESEPDDEGEHEYYLGKNKITKWKKKSNIE